MFQPNLAFASLSGALLVGAALGCVGGDSDSSAGGAPSGVRNPFIAFSADFADYRTWKSVPAQSTDAPASTHTSGPRTVYINHVPPAGSKTFPVGTIIVKESTDVPLTERTVFAMVKRGGGYNAQGATDWEWFELKNVDAKSAVILWHGVGPPAGEKYAGDPNGGCNVCHGARADNDFVQTTGLSLASF